MSYSDLLKIDPTLARQLRRAITAPGEAYHYAGYTFRRKYAPVNSSVTLAAASVTAVAGRAA